MAQCNEGVSDHGYGDLWCVWITLIYFGSYLFIGIIVSIIAECKKKHDGSWESYCESFRRCFTYYFQFLLHIFDESLTVGFISAIYLKQINCFGNNFGLFTGDWILNTIVLNESQILLLSIIFFILYRIISVFSMFFIDVFPWYQIIYQFLGLNFLYEIYIAHSQVSKSPILPWLYKQHVYCESIGQYFFKFTYLTFFHFNIPKTSPEFTIILLSVLFGLFNVTFTTLYTDKYAFKDSCHNVTQQGFRLRFAYRGAELHSRFIWLSFFWYFLGNWAMIIYLSIVLSHSIYCYIRGFLRSEIHHIITNLFIVPDLSVGMQRNDAVDLWDGEKIFYFVSHFGCVLVLFWQFADKELKVVDIMVWTHVFEDLMLWAFVIGYTDQSPQSCDLCPNDGHSSRWDLLLTDSLFLSFFILGLIMWFFRIGYFMTLRVESMFSANSRPLSVISGVLGLAQAGQWNSLEKFLPRIAKSSLNRQDGNGKTALHYAIDAKEWRICKTLMKEGADVNITDNQDRTAVHAICACRTFPTSERQLFNNCIAQIKDPAQSFDRMNKNIMHLVCENSSCYIPMLERVKCIMEQFPNFDLNMTDLSGETPLHIACQLDNRDLINYLIEKGANPNALSNTQKTPLMVACEKTSNGVTIRALLKDKAVNIDAQDSNGYTALHFAAINNNRDGLNALLEHSPDVTILTSSGKTAAELAADREHFQIAEDLIMKVSAIEYERKENGLLVSNSVSEENDKEKNEDSNNNRRSRNGKIASSKVVVLDKDIKTEKYIKMISAGLTIDTIEHKMKLDGLSSTQIDTHLAKVKEAIDNKSNNYLNDDNKEKEMLVEENNNNTNENDVLIMITEENNKEKENSKENNNYSENIENEPPLPDSPNGNDNNMNETTIDFGNENENDKSDKVKEDNTENIENDSKIEIEKEKENENDDNNNNSNKEENNNDKEKENETTNDNDNNENENDENENNNNNNNKNESNENGYVD